MKTKFGLMFLTAVFCLFAFKQANAQAVSYPSFADLAEELLPSVVNISTIHKPEATDEETSPEFLSPNPVIEHYFNQKGNNQVSLGSGFIIDEQGYIVTNSHVIDKAEAITVILSDNSKAEARLVGVDKKTDLALIKVETPKKLTPVKIGDSDKIRVGDWILAIGNPFGLGGSVTAGIVSAKSRDIESGPYDNFIQTDASINQGSSGGPMFNMQGELIGINSAIFSTTGTNMGIGFAIPVNLATWVIEQLKTKGEVKRGWIGIKIQPNNEEIAASLGLNANQGVLVSGLSDNSPAQKAGIQAGDIILSFNKHQIDNTKNLSRLVAETEVGQKVETVVWRNKQQQSFMVEIEPMPAEPEKAPKAETKETAPTEEDSSEDAGFLKNLGIHVSEIDAYIMDKYHLSAGTKGVIVTEVYANSDAVNKGLRAGDVIVKIDKKDVFGLSDVQNYINEAKMENNRPVLLLVQDKDIMHFVAVKLRESNE